MGAILVLAACAGFGGGGGRPNRAAGNPAPPDDREQNVRLMLSYDENSDGKVARAELEDGLKRQFAAADANGDGRLDVKETQDENDRRWRASGTEASPLMDWNQDSFVSFDEFATTARSVFAELDQDKDGMLQGNELRLQRGRGGAAAPMRGPGEGGEQRRRGG